MKSLKNFPEDFLPLVVVTGDRREVPPQSVGDLLAYSVSNTDFMYMNYLKTVNSLTLSDKQFVIDSETGLREKFGETNILVIGSPAVNLLARRINRLSAFRFAISDETEADLKEQNDFITKFVHDEDDLFIYQQCLDGIIAIDAVIDRFRGLEPNIAALGERAKQMLPEFRKTGICRDIRTHPRPIRFLMHKLDKPGIVDSLSGTIRGESIPAYKDYGLISVIKNPFTDGDDYYVIYVAGVHGPGTALGLKMLSDKKAFDDHPYGGVFEVKIDRFAGFFEKFQQSSARWETFPYEENAYNAADLILGKTIRVFLSSPASKTDEEQKLFNQKLTSLLKEAGESIGFNIELEEPYTLALGGAIDFWQAILDFEKNCHFIIHDITNCANGVMVEIGFSIGKRKQYFLIWNQQKSPVKQWSQMRIPSLLPTVNIDIIDLDDLAATKQILKKKIIYKARENLNNPSCPSCNDLVKDKNKRTAFVYASNRELENYLKKQLADRNILRLDEGHSAMEARVCRICQTLRVSDQAFIEISEKDPNGFLTLGMAKAIGLKILPISLVKYHKKEFPWVRDIIVYQTDSMHEQLNTILSQFLDH